MKKCTDAARGKAAGGQIQLWYLFRCNGGTQRPNFTTRQVCIFFIWSKSERSGGFCVNGKSFISRETLTIYSEEMVPLLFLQVVCGPSCCTAKGFSLEFQLFPRPQPCRLVLSSAFFLLLVILRVTLIILKTRLPDGQMADGNVLPSVNMMQSLTCKVPDFSMTNKVFYLIDFYSEKIGQWPAGRRNSGCHARDVGCSSKCK